MYCVPLCACSVQTFYAHAYWASDTSYTTWITTYITLQCHLRSTIQALYLFFVANIMSLGRFFNYNVKPVNPWECFNHSEGPLSHAHGTHAVQQRERNTSVGEQVTHTPTRTEAYHFHSHKRPHSVTDNLSCTLDHSVAPVCDLDNGLADTH